MTKLLLSLAHLTFEIERAHTLTTLKVFEIPLFVFKPYKYFHVNLIRVDPLTAFRCRVT